MKKTKIILLFMFIGSFQILSAQQQGVGISISQTNFSKNLQNPDYNDIPFSSTPDLAINYYHTLNKHWDIETGVNLAQRYSFNQSLGNKYYQHFLYVPLGLNLNTNKMAEKYNLFYGFGINTGILLKQTELNYKSPDNIQTKHGLGDYITLDAYAKLGIKYQINQHNELIFGLKTNYGFYQNKKLTDGSTVLYQTRGVFFGYNFKF